MAKKNWLTSFTGVNPVQDPDPVTNAQPDLDDVSAPGAADGDDALSSQPEILRDKLDALCRLTGDSLNAPSKSICAILDRNHTTGNADWVRLGERSSAPAGSAGLVYLYALDDGGTTKAYAKLSNDTQVELGGGGGSGGQTNTVGGSGGILNTGDNVDAVLSPTYGTGADTFCEGNDSRLSDARTPTSHASTHTSGDSDPIKLDDLAAPDDNTDLDATVSAHGLLPKLGGGSTNFLRADGTWAAPTGGSTSPLTTKGDIWGFDTVDDRVPVGADNTVLTADSAEGLGIKYALVANASLATMAQDTIKGRASGAGTGSPQDLTSAQATAILDEFTSGLQGVVPASGGGTTNFLRADGSWEDPGGGGGTLDRYIVFADDTEFGESGTSYVTKKTFRVVRDSAKKNSSWRLLVSLWIEGGGTSAECRLQVGATDLATVSSTETTETNSSIKNIPLTVVEVNEPEDTFLTVNIDLKQTGGGTAKLKFTELYAIYT